MNYKRFPPWRGYIWVPMSSTDHALAGLSLYTPSRRRGLLLRFGAETLVRWFGPGWLPGNKTDSLPPSVDGGWEQIEALLQQQLGPFEAVAIHTRRRPHRPGATLLLLAGTHPVAFVKIGQDPGIKNEYQVLAHMDRSGPRTIFEAPLPLGLYELGENWVAAMTVLPHHRHRPMPRAPLAEVAADVRRTLRQLPRPEGTPAHWVPVHGDLSPWNLRVDADGRVILFDWEEAGFGPPGSDEVYYAITSVVLGLGRPAVVEATPEAVQLWRSRLEARPIPGRLRRVLQRELLRLEGG